MARPPNGGGRLSSSLHERPEFPALLQTVAASRAKRIARGLLAWVFALVAGAASACLVVVLAGRSAMTVPAFVALCGLLAASWGAVFAIWSALGAGWLPDLILGVRVVSVSDGRRTIAGGLARAALQAVLAAVSIGIVPLLAVFSTPSGGRSWVDRLTGVTLLDIRAGRNVLARPVTAGEREAQFAPKAPPRPAIIEVRPASLAQGYTGALQGSVPRHGVTVGAERVGSVSAVTASGESTLVSTSPIVAAPDPRATSATTWILSFDTGERHLLHGRALIGREPAARADFRGADLIRVADPSRTVSGTHLAVTSNELGVWVEDLGSTNGSELRTPNGRAQTLAVRVRTPVSGGSRVRLGDRWMTVERTTR